jgi:prepilin-type N-terminal cleavage/methylation domain-containing protein
LGKGFTLIELLIVVAIIAILAAIAMPNFLEAQARAKIARAMTDMRTVHLAHNAYQIDYNDILRDHNDTDWPQYIKDQMGYNQEFPGIVPDLVWKRNDNSLRRFYSLIAFRPLTTPVAYMSFKPIDPWSHVVPIGLDTREEPATVYAYWVIFCAGPDRVEGDWVRWYSPDGKAIKYDPTNGTISDGDIWRGEIFANRDLYFREYAYPM